MAREAPEIRLIRETLEGVLHPSTAATVFFEALEDTGGALPASPDAVMALVEGPLARRLAERVGEDEASSVLGRLTLMLLSILPKPGERKVRKRPSRHDEPTRDLMLSDATLPVFVLSGSSSFEAQLKASLGPQIMSTVAAADLPTLEERLSLVPPAIVLIDGSDFPAIEPEDLAEVLARLPSHVLEAVWGADLPYGMAVLDAGQRRGVELTPFDRREGIEPLMDVIRSRRARTV